jgi:ribosomal protein L7/L12
MKLNFTYIEAVHHLKASLGVKLQAPIENLEVNIEPPSISYNHMEALPEIIAQIKHEIPHYRTFDKIPAIKRLRELVLARNGVGLGLASAKQIIEMLA